MLKEYRKKMTYEMPRSLLLRILCLILVFLWPKLNAQDLNNHKWKNRILIVKTLKTDSKKYTIQLKELKDSQEEFMERKLVLYTIDNDDVSFVDYTDGVLKYLGKLSRSVIKNTLDKSNPFEVILIGLDGRIKLRQSEILMESELLRIIDAMPMRQSEMKN